LIGTKPKVCNVPIPEKSPPELDTTEELNDKGQAQYQSLIGCLQWVVTLGRFDIVCAPMTMLRFQVALHKGHLELLGHIFGYLQKYLYRAIRFHMQFPAYESRCTPVRADWGRMVYEEPIEEIPENMPTPKGLLVRQTITANANFAHCHVTGRPAMGAIFEVQGTLLGIFLAPNYCGDGYVCK
jgi:hypothetical protein